MVGLQPVSIIVHRSRRKSPQVLGDGPAWIMVSSLRRSLSKSKSSQFNNATVSFSAHCSR